MTSERARRLPARVEVPEDELYPVREVSRWALQSGRPLSPRALEVIIAVKHERREPFRYWSEQVVSELLWSGILTWCRAHEVECPPRVAETLWTYLTLLHEKRSFDLGSEPLVRLQKPLVDVGGLTRGGRERVVARRHPSEQKRSARPSARLAPVVPLRRAARG